MEKFMAEVAPALREAVSKALPELSSDTKIRPASVKAAPRWYRLRQHHTALVETVVDPAITAIRASIMSVSARRRTRHHLRSQQHRRSRRSVGIARARAPAALHSQWWARHQRALDQRRWHRHQPRQNEHGEVLGQTTRRVRIGPGAGWTSPALEPYGWALTSTATTVVSTLVGWRQRVALAGSRASAWG